MTRLQLLPLVFVMACLGLSGGLLALSAPEEYWIITIPLAIIWAVACWFFTCEIADTNKPKILLILKDAFFSAGIAAMGVILWVLGAIATIALIYFAYCFFSWIGATGVIIILLILILLK